MPFRIALHIAQDRHAPFTREADCASSRRYQ
jgi:hypothetical protein